METLENRICRAEENWQTGIACERQGDFQQAYHYFTEAHDLIMDCALYHQKAHEHLRRVNWKLGNYSELVTDWLLHLVAPLGVFELVSYFSKTGAFGSTFCKRNV